MWCLHLHSPVLTVVVFGASAAEAAAAAAVACVLWMTWRMTAFPKSGRGGCCEAGGCDVGGVDDACERTEGWSRGTGGYPGPAGWAWCRSSWGSSWVWLWAAEV